jgi:hypothetical protein
MKNPCTEKASTIRDIKHLIISEIKETLLSDSEIKETLLSDAR